jgi:hypothetical protein
VIAPQAAGSFQFELDVPVAPAVGDGEDEEAEDGALRRTYPRQFSEP